MKDETHLVLFVDQSLLQQGDRYQSPPLTPVG